MIEDGRFLLSQAGISPELGFKRVSSKRHLRVHWSVRLPKRSEGLRGERRPSSTNCSALSLPVDWLEGVGEAEARHEPAASEEGRAKNVLGRCILADPGR